MMPSGLQPEEGCRVHAVVQSKVSVFLGAGAGLGHQGSTEAGLAGLEEAQSGGPTEGTYSAPHFLTLKYSAGS